jgi:hypothetical protein
MDCAAYSFVVLDASGVPVLSLAHGFAAPSSRGTGTIGAVAHAARAKGHDVKLVSTPGTWLSLRWVDSSDALIALLLPRTALDPLTDDAAAAAVLERCTRLVQHAIALLVGEGSLERLDATLERRLRVAHALVRTVLTSFWSAPTVATMQLGRPRGLFHPCKSVHTYIDNMCAALPAAMRSTSAAAAAAPVVLLSGSVVIAGNRAWRALSAEQRTLIPMYLGGGGAGDGDLRDIPIFLGPRLCRLLTLCLPVSVPGASLELAIVCGPSLSLRVFEEVAHGQLDPSIVERVEMGGLEQPLPFLESAIVDANAAALARLRSLSVSDRGEDASLCTSTAEAPGLHQYARVRGEWSGLGSHRDFWSATAALRLHERSCQSGNAAAAHDVAPGATTLVSAPELFVAVARVGRYTVCGTFGEDSGGDAARAGEEGEAEGEALARCVDAAAEAFARRAAAQTAEY